MADQAPLVGLSRLEQIRILGWSVIRTGLGLAGIMWALYLVPETAGASLALPVLIIAVGIGIYSAFFRRQLRIIEASRFPAVRAIEALVLIAAMFLAFFAAIYVMMSASNPQAFTESLDHFNAFYFALTVLATVGFGDITPISDPARMACMVQMAIDIVFIALMIKSLSGAAQRASAFRSARTKGKDDLELPAV